MKRHRSIGVVALAMAVSILAVATLPAAAVDAADYVVWRKWSSDKKAVVLVRETNQGSDISIALKGLDPGDDYRVIGTNSDGPCGSPVNNANRTLGYQNEYAGGASGDLIRVTRPDKDPLSTRYVRVLVVGEGTWACGATNSYEAGPAAGSLFAGSFMFADGSVRFLIIIEALPSNKERATVVLRRPNDDVIDTIVTLRDSQCSNPGSSLAKFTLANSGGGIFSSRTFNLSQAEFDSLRSVRFRADLESAGEDLKFCGNSFVTDLIIDPLAHR